MMDHRIRLAPSPKAIIVVHQAETDDRPGAPLHIYVPDEDCVYVFTYGMLSDGVEVGRYRTVLPPPSTVNWQEGEMLYPSSDLNQGGWEDLADRAVEQLYDALDTLNPDAGLPTSIKRRLMRLIDEDEEFTESLSDLLAGHLSKQSA